MCVAILVGAAGITVWLSCRVLPTATIGVRRRLLRILVLVAGHSLQQLLSTLLKAGYLGLGRWLRHDRRGEGEPQKGRCNSTHLDLLLNPLQVSNGWL